MVTTLLASTVFHYEKSHTASMSWLTKIPLSLFPKIAKQPEIWGNVSCRKESVKISFWFSFPAHLIFTSIDAEEDKKLLYITLYQYDKAIFCPRIYLTYIQSAS